MIGNKKVIVVVPVYNAENTLVKTYNEIPFNIVDDVILVDTIAAITPLNLQKKLALNMY